MDACFLDDKMVGYGQILSPLMSEDDAGEDDAMMIIVTLVLRCRSLYELAPLVGLGDRWPHLHHRHGENDEAPRCPGVNATPEEKKALKDWKQGKSKVMYWLSMSVLDSMMGYLKSAPSPAIAWKSLEKLNEDHTRVRKLQLKTELNTVNQGNMFINDYASKIKTIKNSLGSIGVTVDDDDVVAATLEGLGTECKNFKSSMNTRADVADFTELTTMLIREEKSLGLGASSKQYQF
ncbi:hypothetical protein L7F22_041564 [Adiantum nelumboides]|nr:hypothetical protein [Adiantum nelumboides]